MTENGNMLPASKCKFSGLVSYNDKEGCDHQCNFEARAATMRDAMNQIMTDFRLSCCDVAVVTYFSVGLVQEGAI